MRPASWQCFQCSLGARECVFTSVPCAPVLAMYSNYHVLIHRAKSHSLCPVVSSHSTALAHFSTVPYQIAETAKHQRAVIQWRHKTRGTPEDLKRGIGPLWTGADVKTKSHMLNIPHICVSEHLGCYVCMTMVSQNHYPLLLNPSCSRMCYVPEVLMCPGFTVLKQVFACQRTRSCVESQIAWWLYSCGSFQQLQLNAAVPQQTIASSPTSASQRDLKCLR